MKIYVAGHNGMVGSSIVKKLNEKGYNNLILKSHAQLELLDQKKVFDFLKSEKPDYILLFAWTFENEIRKRNKDFFNNGGKIILPLPEIKILD